ncbi:MAG TPA: hypothetical protein VN408_21605 [Actinoplanes sp.]|nr:hypothetical protein [Actinoplanes sp.]
MTTALLITGTVGVGKTTAAEAVGDLLTERAVPHAVIDLDWLRRAWPSPPDDPFQHRLTVRNLHTVTGGFREAGAQRLILAGVVETGTERADYEAAVGAPLTVCRLTTDIAAVRARLHHRHPNDPDGLTWHLNRSTVLDRILEAARIEDFTIDTTGLTPSETARQILVHW